MIREEQLVASILEKMPDFQISVSDLKAPTARFVQSYFIRFLQELDVDAEKFHLTDNQTGTMTCPYAIGHIVPSLQLFGAVNHIAKQIFIKDLSLTDIIQPKRSRTVYLLNCFDRFHMYADMVAARVQDDGKELLERKREYKQLEAQINSLQQKLEHQGNIPISNDVLRQEIDELKKKLVHKRQEISELDEQILNVDSTVEKLEMKHEKVSSEYHKVKDKLAELQKQTVTSPEVDQMALRLRNLEKKKEEGEKRVQELQTCVQEKTRHTNLFKKYISDLECGTEQVHTIVKLATQNKVRCEKTQVLEKRQLSATNKEADLKDKLAKVDSKMKQLNEQKKTSETAMEQELAEGKSKIEEAEKELAECTKKDEEYADLRKRMSEVEQEIVEKVEFNKKLCDMYDKLYEKRVQQMNAHLDKLGLLDEE